MADAEDRCEGSISVGGLYAKIAETLTLNNFVEQPGFPEQFKASFAPGETEIWYRDNEKSDEDEIPFWDVKPPKISTLREKYILLGKIAEQHLGTIFAALQGENWQPLGSPPGSPAYMFLTRLGIKHSSISVGDVVKIGDRAWMCERVGWKELEA